MEQVKEITIFEANSAYTSAGTIGTMIPSSLNSLTSGTVTQTRAISFGIKFEELSLTPPTIKGLSFEFQYKNIREEITK